MNVVIEPDGGIYGAQERVSLRAANLAEKDPVRTQAHRGLQQALDRHARLALIAFGSDQRQEVFLQRLHLSGVFDRDDALVRRNLF